MNNISKACKDLNEEWVNNLEIIEPEYSDKHILKINKITNGKAITPHRFINFILAAALTISILSTFIIVQASYSYKIYDYVLTPDERGYLYTVLYDTDVSDKESISGLTVPTGGGVYSTTFEKDGNKAIINYSQEDKYIIIEKFNIKSSIFLSCEDSIKIKKNKSTDYVFLENSDSFNVVWNNGNSIYTAETNITDLNLLLSFLTQIK